MITILKVIFLSFIEGLTEFIPVSSTGHMIIVEHFMKLSENRQFVNAFYIIIQLGAILSVIVYFFRKIFPLNIQLWKKIVVAVMPAVVLGLLLDDYIDKYLFSPIIVSATLIIYGLILIFLEKGTKKFKIDNINYVSYRKAFTIGVFQCLAMIPGTSRSASTIIGAMLLGINRIVATEFSFFLAIPTMLGATVLKLVKVRGLVTYEYFLIFLGFIFSFIFAYIFISIFLNYIKKHSFAIFGYYRIVLGILVLILIKVI